MGAYSDGDAVKNQAAREWDSNPHLREEFGGRREAWLAYAAANAQGLVKIHGGGGMVPGADIRGTSFATDLPARCTTSMDHLTSFRDYAAGRIDEIPLAHQWHALTSAERAQAGELVRQGLRRVQQGR